MRPPLSVNLPALLSRFPTTCASRAGSACSLHGLRRQRDRQLVLHAAVQVADGFHRLLDDGRQVDSLLAQLDLAPRDPADVEQIVDEARHLADLPLQHLRGRPERFSVASDDVQGADGVADRRKRVAQLVRQHRQELVLPPIRLRQVQRQPLQAVFEPLSFGFRALALRDVDADRRERDNPAGLVADWLDGEVDDAFGAVGDKVGHLGAEHLPGGGLPRRGLDGGRQLARGRPPWALPERLADDLLRRVPARFPRQAVRLDERPVQVHDAGEERALIEKRTEFGVRRRGFGQQLALALLSLSMAGHVAHDLRRADHLAGLVLDRRDGQRDEDRPAVASNALGFEVLDPPALFQAGDDVIFLGETVGRDDQRDVAADRLGRAIPEQALGAGVPALNDAIERLADDRVVRRLDDRREQPGGQQLARAFTLDTTLRGDIPERQHTSGHDAVLVADRRGAVVNRALAAVLADEQRVVRQADDHSFTQRLRRGAFDRAARALADDAEDGIERLPDRIGRPPAGQRFGQPRSSRRPGPANRW